MQPLSDEQRAEIRLLAGRGWSQAEVARVAGVSRASVSRVVRDGPAPAAPGPLASAVSAFLAALELDDERRLRAIALQATAATIDRCTVASSAGSAAALPGLVRSFRELLDELAPARVDVAGEVARLMAPLRGLPSA